MNGLFAFGVSVLVLSGNGAPQRGRIVWTIDDGPHLRATRHQLNLLDRYCLRATWYVAGFHLSNPDNWPNLREIVRRGHLLGNHLWTHRRPCKEMTVPQVLGELRATDRRMRRILSGSWAQYRSRIRRWYRPPYGDQCRRVNAAIRQAGYGVHMWDVPDVGPVKKLARWIQIRVNRGQRTVVLWHHRWKKLTKLLEILERSGHVVRCKAGNRHVRVRSVHGT